jgi:hypothetical protein
MRSEIYRGVLVPHRLDHEAQNLFKTAVDDALDMDPDELQVYGAGFEAAITAVHAWAEL